MKTMYPVFQNPRLNWKAFPFVFLLTLPINSVFLQQDISLTISLDKLLEAEKIVAHQNKVIDQKSVRKRLLARSSSRSAAVVNSNSNLTKPILANPSFHVYRKKSAPQNAISQIQVAGSTRSFLTSSTLQVAKFSRARAEKKISTTIVDKCEWHPKTKNYD